MIAQKSQGFFYISFNTLAIWIYLTQFDAIINTMVYNLDKDKFTLLHYVHCPYCIRVRMAFGFLEIPYQSEVLRYDDEKTPIELCDAKMLPIVKGADFAWNESLDIITRLNSGKLSIPDSKRLAELEGTCNKLGKEIHSLAMPYIVYTPEFDEQSRQYFQAKKEKKRGPFKELLRNSSQLLETLSPKLLKIESQLSPFYESDKFGLGDIMIASHLWSMFLVPEFQFSTVMYEYLMRIKDITNFHYHADYLS